LSLQAMFSLRLDLSSLARGPCGRDYLPEADLRAPLPRVDPRPQCLHAGVLPLIANLPDRWTSSHPIQSRGSAAASRPSGPPWRPAVATPRTGQTGGSPPARARVRSPVPAPPLTLAAEKWCGAILFAPVGLDEVARVFNWGSRAGCMGGRAARMLLRTLLGFMHHSKAFIAA
jgi:hypothetical protein